jgi:hypothetical protein
MSQSEQATTTCPESISGGRCGTGSYCRTSTCPVDEEVKANGVIVEDPDRDEGKAQDSDNVDMAVDLDQFEGILEDAINPSVPAWMSYLQGDYVPPCSVEYVTRLVNDYDLGGDTLQGVCHGLTC